MSINYEAEVKKVYPDACLVPSVFWDLCWVVRSVKIGRIKIPRWIWDYPMSDGKTVSDAWQSAYDTLKNSGKIK